MNAPFRNIAPGVEPLFKGAEWDFDLVKKTYDAIEKIGVGGLILVFRIGPMPHEVATNTTR